MKQVRRDSRKNQRDSIAARAYRKAAIYLLILFGLTFCPSWVWAVDGSDTFYGVDAGNSTTTGGNDSAFGYAALSSNTTGSENTACGQEALASNSTGSGNIGLGFNAGSYLTGDNNIDIGNLGAADETGVIRIGTQGTQTATFLAGITGVTLTNPMAVTIDSNGQLGSADISTLQGPQGPAGPQSPAGDTGPAGP